MTTTTVRPSPETAEQIIATYRRLAKEGKYRPCAPSDGMGNVTGPLNLKREAEEFVTAWWEMEYPQHYVTIGCPDWPARPALIFAVSGAELICGLHYKAAARLLRMAADEIEALEASEKGTLKQMLRDGELS